MRNTPVVSLQDSILGDEGCRVLVEFLRAHNHDHITKLDLKGNHIGERGVVILSQLLSENDSIKKISLEWNNVGMSDSGVQALCSALMHNASLNELDLRNNKIQPSQAQYLAELIKSNKSLKKIDLRWNELGRQGAQTLLQAIQQNPIIQYVEMAGNKGAEEFQQVIENYLARNRGEMGGLSKLLAGVPGKENEVPYAILQKEKEFADDIKAKYEAQVIAHSRTEKRVRELEKSLESERRKLKSTNTELVRSLEEEKIARRSIEVTLNKLKEDFSQRELEKDKLISDLSIKYDKVKIERAQYELELNKTRDSSLRNEQVYIDKISTLEEQLSKSQNLYVELDESSRFQINKLRKETSESTSDIQKRYEVQIRQREDNLRAVMHELEEARQMNTRLKTDNLERKADEEIRLNEKLKELNNLQKQFHDAIVQEQEMKLRMGSQQQEKLAKFQEDLKSELDKVYYTHQKDVEQSEQKINRLRDEKSNESKEVVKAQQGKTQVEAQSKLLQSEIEKLKHEKAELQNQLRFAQDKDQAIKDNVKQEFSSEISNLRQQNQALIKRADDLEGALNSSRKDNANLRQDFERLGEIMSHKIQEALDQAFIQSSSISGGNSGAGKGVNASAGKAKSGSRF